MDIQILRSDDAILAEIGRRIARRRVELDLTQAELAEQAGISKRTVERLENGASIQMSTMIRVFRALKMLDGLERLIPETGPRPLELLKARGKQRRRASSKNRKDQADQVWSWGDEQ